MKEYIFSDYIKEQTLLPPDHRQLLLEKNKVLERGRRELLLSAGDTCHHCFFIERGAVREYSIDKQGKEHILHFATEGWFIMNVDTVFFNRPSSYFIETIEPSRVLLIERERIDALLATGPCFEQFFRYLLYEHIQVLQQRITALQSSQAEDRYLYFIKQYPEALLRIPQLMIASYLGITPESLSRIRSQLAHRHKQQLRTS